MKPIKTSTDKILGDKYEHPAYGMISCSRVSGGNIRLVGSELVHNHYVSLRIQTATRNRELARDWFFPRDQVVEIHLSEHQWSTFVASMNQGSGVPCTFRYRPDGKTMMDIPSLEEENMHDIMQNELEDAGREIAAKLQTLTDQLQTMADAKGSIKKTEFKNIVKSIQSAVHRVVRTLPFHVDSHKEMMEKNVQAAKSDVEGYVTGIISRLGIESLRDMAPQLEDHTEDN